MGVQQRDQVAPLVRISDVVQQPALLQAWMLGLMREDETQLLQRCTSGDMGGLIGTEDTDQDRHT